MAAWEYHVHHTNIRLRFQELWTAKVRDEASNWDLIQGLGREGWELVSCIPMEAPTEGTVSVAWVFKRPLPE